MTKSLMQTILDAIKEKREDPESPAPAYVALHAECYEALLEEQGTESIEYIDGCKVQIYHDGATH